MGNSAKRDARAIAKQEQVRKALELRIAGLTYARIADAGLGPGLSDASNVSKAVKSAIAAITEEPAEEVKRLELWRLDYMLGGLWKAARGGDVPAVTAVLRIQERRAAYLGLDAPKTLKVELDRALGSFLDRIKMAFAPELYEQILAVAIGEPGPAAAGADPSPAAEDDDRGSNEPG